MERGRPGWLMQRGLPLGIGGYQEEFDLPLTYPWFIESRRALHIRLSGSIFGAVLVCVFGRPVWNLISLGEDEEESKKGDSREHSGGLVRQMLTRC